MITGKKKCLRKHKWTVYLLMACFCITNSNLFSQNTTQNQEEPELRFGFHVSPSIAWMKTDVDNDGTGNRAGFSYGLIIEKNTGHSYTFATGIDVTYKGGDVNVLGVNYDFMAQYIEIPLTVKMRTRPIGYMTYFARAGIAPAIKIQEEVTLDPEFSLLDEEPSRYIRNLALSMIISIGAEYSLGSGTALVGGVTFNNNFTDIMKNFEGEDRTIFNYFAFNFGVLF